MSTYLHQLGFPHPAYFVRNLGRTVLMWVLVKLFLLAGIMISGADPGEALLLPSLGIPALFVFIDRHRAHERLLQANLGASGWWIGGSSAAVCLLLDVVSVLIGATRGSG